MMRGPNGTLCIPGNGQLKASLVPSLELLSGNELGLRERQIVDHFAIDYGGWTPNHALILYNPYKLPSQLYFARALTSTGCETAKRFLSLKVSSFTRCNKDVTWFVIKGCNMHCVHVH